MGEPDPRDRESQVDVRLLRVRDLIDLRLEAPGCHLEPTENGAELVAGPDAQLIVHFPPQHLGEQVWQAGAIPPPPVPSGPSGHVAAGPTRLAYEIPDGTRIDYDLGSILTALPTLRLRVAANATPAGESSGNGGPRPPAADETAIEAPYHLIVSPSSQNAFRHSPTPVGPAPDRTELWRSHLTVRRDDGTLDDTDEKQRIVRGLWNADKDSPPPGFTQPLISSDRTAIVAQTHGGLAANADKPLLVSNLALSSLGAWLDWKQSWELPASIVDYRHQAFMGRDGYVRVVYPGFLFPFGHRAYLVKISEREIKHRDRPVAYLWQRWFIIVRQPTRGYGADRDNPFAQVTLSPLVTPDLDVPAEDGDQSPFIPRRAGTPFTFTLTTVDRAGEVRTWAAPLVFVQAGMSLRLRRPMLINGDQAPGLYEAVQQIQGRGQTLSVAPPVETGDTAVETTHLIFTGDLDAANVTSRPRLKQLRAVLPSMRHLAPQAPAVDLVLAKPYLDFGLPSRTIDTKPGPGHPNAGELILSLASSPPAVDFTSGSDRSGGFVAPNLVVNAVSRGLGAVGDKGTGGSPLQTGTFDPTAFLGAAMPKLFGLFSLLELLEAAGLDEAPAFVSDALDAVTKLLTEAQRLKAALEEAQQRLAAEVADGAHDGAKAVAQQAKDALDAQTAALTSHADALIAAVRNLPDQPEAVSAAAVALAGDLDPLLTAIGLPGVPAAVRSALSKPVQTLKTLTELASDAAGLARLFQGLAGGQVTAQLSWRPKIKPWGLSGVPNIFFPHSDHPLHLDVEVRASASAPPAVDILAEIVDFDLNLIGTGSGGLMKLMFRRIGFRAGSAGKAEVDVVFGGIGFLGPLSFVDRLRELIPFDGFADPPYVDVAPEGVTAGFDLTLPNVSVGVFSLENISLGADARVPFLGDALTVGFHFCSKDSPFRLTVMCIGGGGWLALRASPKGLVLLELGLEACACLSVDLGVASGSVSIAVGVYLRLESDKGLLTAYFRIRGEVDVLGLISASITLELSLTYHFETGKLIGRASLVVEVEVLFFSASVEISVERKLAGSKGDPTLKEIMPPSETDGLNADWALYCDAFAPVPAEVTP